MDFEIKRNNAFKTIVSYFLVSLIGSLFVSIFIGLLQIKNVAVGASLANLLTYILLLVAVVLINKKELIEDLNGFKNGGKPYLRIFGGLGIFYVISLFTSTLVSNIEFYSNFANSVLGKHNVITSTAQNQTDIEAMLSGGGLIMMILAAGVIGPFCEEVVFRKAFFNLFKSKELGILVSSLAFGMIHIISSIGTYNLTSMALMTFPYIAGGVALGIIYIKNDCNVITSTIVHMLTNIISIIGIVALA